MVGLATLDLAPLNTGKSSSVMKTHDTYWAVYHALGGSTAVSLGFDEDYNFEMVVLTVVATGGWVDTLPE